MSSRVSAFDRKWYERVHKLPLNDLVYATTVVGHPLIIAIIVALTGFALYDNNYKNLAYRVAIFLPLLFVVSAIKLFIHRVRPKESFKGRVLIDFYSFPSGHAYASMMLTVIFTYLAWVFLSPAWTIAIAIMFGATTLLVGLTRVYIQAHFMSDVIGGWLIALPISIAIFAL